MNSAALKPDGNVTHLSFSKNGIDWIVDDRYHRLIPDEMVTILLSPGVSGQNHIIRDNKVRRSMVLAVPGRREFIFAKLYKRPTGTDRYKYFFLASKSSSEWKHMLSLYERGLPVARPLARGEKRRLHLLLESFLFTEALNNAQPLSAILKQNLPPLLKRGLTEKAALLVAAVHNQGFFFRDLHAGNIVHVPGEQGGFHLFLVDFHKVWHTRWVPRWMRIRDLAQLRNSVSLTRAGQWRFLKLYAQQSHLASSGLGDFARRIEVLARKMWMVHLRSRTKRCLKESTEFSIGRKRHYKIYRHKVFPQELIDTVLECYGHHPSRPKPVILKNTGKEAVAVVTVNYGGAEHKVVIKESSFSLLASRIRYSFFNSRAKRSWIAARALRVRGIPTPDTLALIEYRSSGMIEKTLLLMQYLDHTHELNDYVLKCYNRSLSSAELQGKVSFIAALAAQIRAMHDKGVYHADLKSNNILVWECGERWVFYIIDLDRISFKQSLSFRERANNLAQINASVADCITPADRLLFFRLYARGTPLIKQGKKYVQSIMEIGRSKNTKPYGVSFPEADKRTL